MAKMSTGRDAENTRGKQVNDSLRAAIQITKEVQMYGTITLYNNSRGFGFITSREGQQYFFHISNFVKGQAPPVLEGQVRFDVGAAIEVGKKDQALNVQYVHEKKTVDVAAESALALLEGKS